MSLDLQNLTVDLCEWPVIPRLGIPHQSVETQLGLHMQCPLLLFGFDQN
jgi:hypothetical protein